MGDEFLDVKHNNWLVTLFTSSLDITSTWLQKFNKWSAVHGISCQSPLVMFNNGIIRYIVLPAASLEVSIAQSLITKIIFGNLRKLVVLNVLLEWFPIIDLSFPKLQGHTPDESLVITTFDRDECVPVIWSVISEFIVPISVFVNCSECFLCPLHHLFGCFIFNHFLLIVLLLFSELFGRLHFNFFLCF